MRHKTAASDDMQSITAVFTPLAVTSPVFRDGELLPLQYTCDGANINPSLDIAGIPKDTESLAIVMADVDTPGGRLIHWMAWNIPPAPHIIEARPMEAEGINDLRTTGYRGPCPSVGKHRYTFHVYALDVLLRLQHDAKEPDLKAAMSGHILGYGKITALYARR